MFSVEILIWLLLLGTIGLYWWHSGQFKGRARELAQTHCQQLGIQLLDQSMVITGFWPTRNATGRLAFRRAYQFEFSSTGDSRYRGKLVLVGMTLKSIELDTYKLPPAEN